MVCGRRERGRNGLPRPLLCQAVGLVFVFVEKEVFFIGIVGPYVFYGFVDFTFFFEFFQVLYDLHGSTRAECIVDEFVFCCRPWCIFEF